MTLTSSVPVLRVADYQKAKSFWTGALGFTVVNEAGDPVTGFGIFCRDQAQVFLSAWDGPEASYNRWRAYFHCDDLEKISDCLKSFGASFNGPVVAEYGMQELEVTDPSGNVVCFGQEMK